MSGQFNASQTIGLDLNHTHVNALLVFEKNQNKTTSILKNEVEFQQFQRKIFIACGDPKALEKIF